MNTETTFTPEAALLPDGTPMTAEAMAERLADPGDHVRQGDVLLMRRSATPQGASPIERDGGRVVLAYGEVTGHAHALYGLQVTHYRESGNWYLTVADTADPLIHEEHSAIVIPPGDYELGLQVEYSPAELRAVAD